MKTAILLLALFGTAFAAPQAPVVEVEQDIEVRNEESTHTENCSGHGHEGEARAEQTLEAQEQDASDVRSDTLVNEVQSDQNIELRQEATAHAEECSGHGHEGEARVNLEEQEAASEVRTDSLPQLDVAAEDSQLELRQEETAPAGACSGHGPEGEARVDQEGLEARVDQGLEAYVDQGLEAEAQVALDVQSDVQV